MPGPGTIHHLSIHLALCELYGVATDSLNVSDGVFNYSEEYPVFPILGREEILSDAIYRAASSSHEVTAYLVTYPGLGRWGFVFAVVTLLVESRNYFFYLRGKLHIKGRSLGL